MAHTEDRKTHSDLYAVVKHMLLNKCYLKTQSDQNYHVICFSLASDIQITLLNHVMSSIKNCSLAEMKLVHLIRLQGFCTVPSHILIFCLGTFVLMGTSPYSRTLASVLLSHKPKGSPSYVSFPPPIKWGTLLPCTSKLCEVLSWVTDLGMKAEYK